MEKVVRQKIVVEAALVDRVAEILALEDRDNWAITDVYNKLALVHYKEGADTKKYGYLRGVLVDTEMGVVLAKSFGYTPKTIANSIEVGESGLIHLTDTEANVHSFSPEEVICKRVFEGVVIRVIWFQGEALHITHKKIRPVNSRWGSSPFFPLIYKEGGGPQNEELFDTTKQYSDSYHAFMVIHPTLLVGTRQKVSHPYVVFLGTFASSSGRSSDEIGVSPPSFKSSSELPASVEEPFVHNPLTLTIPQANAYLQYGFYTVNDEGDLRERNGEAVILYICKEGNIVDILKVHSVSYEWRTEMRGNNPNISNQFYHLIDLVGAENDLHSKVISLADLNQDVLQVLYDREPCLKTLFKGTENIPATRDARIALLWINFVISLPPSEQMEGLNILPNFLKDRADLVEWLKSLSKKKKLPEEITNTRVKGILGQSRKQAGKNVNKKDIPKKFHRSLMDEAFSRALEAQVKEEKGPSLYKLVKSMKEAKGERPRREKREKQEATQ